MFNIKLCVKDLVMLPDASLSLYCYFLFILISRALSLSEVRFQNVCMNFLFYL